MAIYPLGNRIMFLEEAAGEVELAGCEGDNI
jgi:hypothetical protein